MTSHWHQFQQILNALQVSIASLDQAHATRTLQTHLEVGDLAHQAHTVRLLRQFLSRAQMDSTLIKSARSTFHIAWSAHQVTYVLSRLQVD